MAILRALRSKRPRGTNGAARAAFLIDMLLTLHTTHGGPGLERQVGSCRHLSFRSREVR